MRKDQAPSCFHHKGTERTEPTPRKTCGLAVSLPARRVSRPPAPRHFSLCSPYLCDARPNLGPIQISGFFCHKKAREFPGLRQCLHRVYKRAGGSSRSRGNFRAFSWPKLAWSSGESLVPLRQGYNGQVTFVLPTNPTLNRRLRRDRAVRCGPRAGVGSVLRGAGRRVRCHGPILP